MANEFVIREGFISESDTIITGSLIVTAGITGSLVTASYAITASYSLNSLTASLVSNITTASYTNFATSASIATLGSFVPNYVNNYTATQLNPVFNTGSTGIGYISPMMNNMINTVAAYSNRQFNTIYLTPLYINSNCIVRKIGILAQKNLSGNQSIRLGIYTNSNLMLPDTNLSDVEIFPLGDNISRFYETTLSTPINLQAGEIYWLASMLCGTGTIVHTNINYRTVQPQFTVQQLSANRIYNQLLGSSTPINQNAIKHISYYAYTVASTASLQTTLPQTAGSYIVYSYGGTSAAVASHTQTFIPPMIYVNYQ